MIHCIALCDDDQETLQELEILMKDISKTIHLPIEIDSYKNPKTLLKAIETDCKYHAIFLDIEMPGITGLDLGKTIRDHKMQTEIIFVSPYDHLERDAVCIKAFDLIRKRNMKVELSKVLTRLKNQWQENLGKIEVIVGGERRRILAKNIIYMESKKNYIDMHLSNGEIVKARGTMNQMEEQAVPCQFIRIHASYLMNFIYIEKVEEHKVYMKEIRKEPFCMSRGKAKQAKRRYMDYTIGAV